MPCSIYWISDPSPQDSGQPLFPLSCDLRLINQHAQHSFSPAATGHPTLPPATSHQLQHPWASSAGGEASEQAKNDDDGPGANEDVRGVGGVVGYQRDVRAQHQLPPYSHRQQDGSCYLEGGGGWRDGCNRESTGNRMKAGNRPLSLHFFFLRCYNSGVLAARRRGWGRRTRIKVEQERRAIRARRRRRETEDTNISGVRHSDHLLYEYACTHTRARARRKKERKRKGTRQRSSLIRGETLPPVAPLLAFQMKAADKRARCARQLKRRVSQLGMSCWQWEESGVWSGC